MTPSPNEKMKPCIWTYDEDSDSWDTKCDEKFYLCEGKPKDNKMKFCPYCGGKLKEAAELIKNGREGK